MRTAHRILGTGIFTPSLMAVVTVGRGQGFGLEHERETDTRNYRFRKLVVAHLKGRCRPGGRSAAIGLAGGVDAVPGATVPLSADYLAAAVGFLTSRSAGPFWADRMGAHRFDGHLDRVADLIGKGK